MEQEKIKELLEKYWAAETTLEEERILAEYFRQTEVPAGLEAMQGVFAWRDDEAGVKVGADFDRRLLRRIGEMERGGVESRVERMEGAGSKGIRLMFRFAAAAAIILCLGIGLLVPVMSPGPRQSSVVAKKTATTITDTYSDPQQALAAVRQALLVASVRINEGKHITQKNITRFHNSWQAVTGD